MILRAAQDVVSNPDFDSMLDQTRDRVDEIEGELHCTMGWVGLFSPWRYSSRVARVYERGRQGTQQDHAQSQDHTQHWAMFQANGKTLDCPLDVL